MNKRGFQLKDIDDKEVLMWFYSRQGKWTSFWSGYFAYGGKAHDGKPVDDAFFAFRPQFDPRLRHKKLARLVERKLLGGCGCGCRGDFEITDKGLQLLGLPRTRTYNGY